MANEETKDLTIVPDKPVAQQAANGDRRDVHDLGVSVNYLMLSADQREILEAPMPIEDLDIKPTGEVYASQIQYRRRLNKAFGPGAWSLREESEPKIDKNQVIQKWSLWAQGIYIGVAWGSQDYYPNNSRMNWTDAIESAKSNAMTRCCKDLGIASECW